MKIIESISEMQQYSIQLKGKGKTLANVSTTGFLHKGHMHLVDIAKENADEVVLNIDHIDPYRKFKLEPDKYDKYLKISGNAVVTQAITATENNYTTTEKNKLAGISDSANNFTYTLPNATDSVLGGVKQGSNVSIANGVLTANVQSTNDYTSAEKTKLGGIAESANNYSLPNDVYLSSSK